MGQGFSCKDWELRLNEESLIKLVSNDFFSQKQLKAYVDLRISISRINNKA